MKSETSRRNSKTCIARSNKRSVRRISRKWQTCVTALCRIWSEKLRSLRRRTANGIRVSVISFTRGNLNLA